MDQQQEGVTAAAQTGEQSADLSALRLVHAPSMRAGLQVLAPRAILEASLRALQDTLAGNIRLHLELAPETGLVAVNGHQLEVALTNLLVNARNAMSGGGELYVELGNEFLPAPLATPQGLVSRGSYVTIRIRDSGVGLAGARLHSAFEPFFRTPVPESGNGLGLSIVRRLVDDASGHASIDAAAEGGTEVCLRLPRVEASESAVIGPLGSAARASAAQDAPLAVLRDAPVGTSDGNASSTGFEAQASPHLVSSAAGDAAPAAEPEQTSVLLVEDDENVRTLTGQMLASLGFRVDAVPDGATALGRLPAPGAYDLLLCDMMLGDGVCGAEVATDVVRLQPEIRVVFMSGYAPEDLRDRVGGLSALPPLRKPFRMKELAERLRRELETPLE